MNKSDRSGFLMPQIVIWRLEAVSREKKNNFLKDEWRVYSLERKTLFAVAKSSPFLSKHMQISRALYYDKTIELRSLNLYFFRFILFGWI